MDGNFGMGQFGHGVVPHGASLSERSDSMLEMPGEGQGFIAGRDMSPPRPGIRKRHAE